MAVEEMSCNGFLKLEESPREGLITYKRRKRASPASDAVQVLDISSHRNKDIGWAHGEIVDGNRFHWMCNWCGLIRYSGGVTRLKKHLAGACHVKKCPNVPEDIAKSMMLNLIERKRCRKKRSIKISGNDGTKLDSFHNDDISDQEHAKIMEMQAASPGRFTKSKKAKISTRRHKSATQQSKTTTQLPESGKTKVMKEPHKTVTSTSNFQSEWHTRIINHWQKVIEYQFNLSYIKPGLGIWNVLHDALALSHSQLTRKLMLVDVVGDNRQLKERTEDPEEKTQLKDLNSYKRAKEQKAAFYASTASYYGEDTNARKCEKAFLDILISEKFAFLCDFLWETFEESKAKTFLNFSPIDSKLKNGDYERSPEYFVQDVQQIWDQVQKMGQEMVNIAGSLSSISRNSCQETGQIGTGMKNSVGADPTIQSNCCGSDCSTKPDRTETDLHKVCTCSQCGTQADDGHSLICDGCEARYHFSCIKPAIKEIPTQSWYCSACSAKNKDSPEPSSIDAKKCSLHQNCVVCDRLEISETHEDLDEHDSRTIVATDDSGESSVSGMESEEAVGLSGTAMSSLCKICGTCEDEDKKFLVCGHVHCPYKFYHIRCLKSSQIASSQQQNKACWYCPSCLCRACFCDKDDNNIVLCDGCDDAYHTYCMKPPRTSVPRGQWYCVPCNVARAKEGMRRYEQWILQQHRKCEGGQSSEVIGSMDLLLSAAEKLNSEEKLAAGP